MTKRFFLDQHGCAKNQVDGELLIGILTGQGWLHSSEPEDADLIIINSCGFIEPAKRESIEAVVAARTAYPHAKILLAGCLAERYGDVFRTEFQEADAFFGNGDLDQLPALLEQLFPHNSKDAGAGARHTAVSPAPKRSSRSKRIRPFLKPAQTGVCCGERPTILNFPRSAFIKITEGCNNCCTFCAIPLIRGPVRSRPVASILEEIRNFAERGYREFNLIGQDLAVYEVDPEYQAAMNHGEKAVPEKLSGLAQLLMEISRLKGSFGIRLLYIHPDHFPLDILPVMTADARFMPYFDIPFQSGAEPVIRAMNRCGSADRYLELVKTIRTAFRNAESPYGEAVIRTTFLTGFPGETHDDFEKTADFLQKLESLWAGTFVYSPEEGTQAADMKKQVPAGIAEQRKNTLNSLQLRITEQKLAAFCGREVDVLIEELIPAAAEDETEERIALGRAWFQAPEVDGAVVVHFMETQKDTQGSAISAGSFVRVRILAVRGVDLEAAAV